MFGYTYSIHNSFSKIACIKPIPKNGKIIRFDKNHLLTKTKYFHNPQRKKLFFIKTNIFL